VYTHVSGTCSAKSVSTFYNRSSCARASAELCFPTSWYILCDRPLRAHMSAEFASHKVCLHFMTDHGVHARQQNLLPQKVCYDRERCAHVSAEIALQKVCLHFMTERAVCTNVSRTCSPKRLSTFYDRPRCARTSAEFAS
jgi:hypothetical protein